MRALFCLASQMSSSGMSASAATVETCPDALLLVAGRTTAGRSGVLLGIADDRHLDGELQETHFAFGRKNHGAPLNSQGQTSAVRE